MGVLALATPVQAHGLSGGGMAAGFLHPLTGLDHLVMLLAVGTAAAMVGSRLLAWALAGGLLGALLASAGLNLPAAEVLAALAIAAVALLSLRARRPQDGDGSVAAAALAPVTALGVAVHALLHGLEIPSEGSILLWWAGALTASVLVCGGSSLLLQRVPSLRSAAAAAFLLVGGCLTLAAVAAQVHAIPA